MLLRFLKIYSNLLFLFIKKINIYNYKLCLIENKHWNIFFVLVYLFLEYIYFPVFFCARQTNKKKEEKKKVK